MIDIIEESADIGYSEWLHAMLVATITEDAAELDRLGRHTHPVIRQMVARNQHCPKSALTILLSDPDSHVVAGVIRNANCPDHLRVIGSLAGPLAPEIKMTWATQTMARVPPGVR